MNFVKFNKHPLASAVSLGLMCGAILSTPVFAQTDEQDVEKITVKGSFSGGLERAIDVKRNAENVSDSIVAADIGKLPAVNVAEALQRVPGVTIVREAGEGQFISVRGLGPNFQTVTLNGMPMAYNENIRTSGQSGRQFRLRVLPADLIDGVIIHKTASADQMEGGIGSFVEIKTLNPLDRDSFIGGALSMTAEERSGENTPNASLSGGWKNDDETFGIIAGVSVSNREVQFDRLQMDGWDEQDVLDYGMIRTPSDTRYTLEQEKRDRLSLVGGLQFRPSDVLEFDVDILYSEFNNEIAERRITYQIGNMMDTLVDGSERVEDGILRAGTIDTRIRNTTEFSEQKHENLIVIAGARYDVAGWRLEPKISISEANSDLVTPLQRIEYRNSTGAEQLRFDYGSDPVGNAGIVTLDSTADLTDPSIVPFRRYRIRPMNSADEDTTFTFDASTELDFALGSLELTKFQAGIQVSDRSRDYQRRDRSNMVLRDGLTLTDAFNNVAIPANAFDESVDQPEPFVSANADLFYSSYVVDGEFDGVNPSAYDLTPTDSDLRNSYGVDEEITALYARLDIYSEIGGLPLTGNIGLRYVDTDSTVRGTVATAVENNGVVESITAPASFSNSYTELLPSINLNLELNDEMMLRFGLSKTMTRPSLSELRSSINTNSSTLSEIFESGEAALSNPDIDLTASGGNPNLDPYTSINFDVSYEWYFSDFGAFSVAYFRKDVDNYISSDFSVQSIPFAVSDGSTLPVDIVVSSPENVGDAKINGIEFGFTGNLGYGFGLSASLTLNDTDLTLDNEEVGVQSGRIQGVSDTSYSITPFYENGPFEANVSYTYRSEFYTDGNVTVTSRPDVNNIGLRYQKGFGTLDIGASYKITEQVEAFMTGVNMLEESPVSYTDSEAYLFQIHTYGRTLNFGVRGKF